MTTLTPPTDRAALWAFVILPGILTLVVATAPLWVSVILVLEGARWLGMHTYTAALLCLERFERFYRYAHWRAGGWPL